MLKFNPAGADAASIKKNQTRFQDIFVKTDLTSIYYRNRQITKYWIALGRGTANSGQSKHPATVYRWRTV